MDVGAVVGVDDGGVQVKEMDYMGEEECGGTERMVRRELRESEHDDGGVQGESGCVGGGEVQDGGMGINDGVSGIKADERDNLEEALCGRAERMVGGKLGGSDHQECGRDEQMMGMVMGDSDGGGVHVREGPGEAADHDQEGDIDKEDIERE